jgi:hypothetical protein
MQEIQHNIQKGNYKVPSLIEAYNLGDSFIYENIFLGMIEDCVKIEPTQRPKNAAWLVSGIYNPVEGMGLLVHNRDIDCRTLGL